MTRIVIAAFRSKPGRQQALAAVVAKHGLVARDRQLITDRPRIVMQAADGTVLEVFKWRSAQAIESAHANPAGLALWQEFKAACAYVPRSALAEAAHPYSEITPLAP
jgi:hypothetical protein